MRLETTTCSQHGHPEFLLEFNQSTALPHAEWLRDTLQSRVAAGEAFAPGETLSIGWSLLQIQLTPSGSLTVCEPDFKSMPINWVSGASTSVWIAFSQNEVAGSVGLQHSILGSSLRESCLICDSVGDPAHHGSEFILERVSPAGHDSGWFLGCNDESHDHSVPEHLTRVSLYEAAVSGWLHALPFLALPPETFIRRTGDHVQIIHDGQELPIDPGSFLEAYIGS